MNFTMTCLAPPHLFVQYNLERMDGMKRRKLDSYLGNSESDDPLNKLQNRGHVQEPHDFRMVSKSYAGALDYGAFDITLEPTIGEGPCSSFLLAMRKNTIYAYFIFHLFPAQPSGCTSLTIGNLPYICRSVSREIICIPSL